jgi:hypothetical protein
MSHPDPLPVIHQPPIVPGQDAGPVEDFDALMGEGDDLWADDAEFEAFLAELVRVTEPGGKVVVSSHFQNQLNHQHIMKMLLKQEQLKKLYKKIKQNMIQKQIKKLLIKLIRKLK